jgi:hypothetical protein
MSTVEGQDCPEGLSIGEWPCHMQYKLRVVRTGRAGGRGQARQLVFYHNLIFASFSDLCFLRKVTRRYQVRSRYSNSMRPQMA